MPRSFLPIEQILSMLDVAPAGIAEFTGGLTEDQLHTAPNPGEWSVNEILAHLRSCADVWGNCILTIIQQDRPTIRAVNPRTWIKSTNYLEQKFRPSLQAFTAQRAELMAILESLEPKAWERGATVTGAGRPRDWSVLSYARRITEHERSHLKQINNMANTIRG